MWLLRGLGRKAGKAGADLFIALVVAGGAVWLVWYFIKWIIIALVVIGLVQLLRLGRSMRWRP